MLLVVVVVIDFIEVNKFCDVIASREVIICREYPAVMAGEFMIRSCHSAADTT